MRNFGEDYAIENIRRRILEQSRPEKPLPETPRKARRYRVNGSLKSTRKITGFRALYFHYCYLLGIFPKDNPRQNPKRLHFLLREDLRRLDAISAETKLLARCHIDTAEQLLSYKSETTNKIEALSAARKSNINACGR